MPVPALRRLDLPANVSLYDEISREALSCGWKRRELERTAREHPALIVRRGRNILTAVAGGGLAYAFESDRAFIESFPAMFESLLPKLRRELHADNVQFRLTHNPSRPLIEPVLRNLSFLPSRSWLQFTLPRTPPLAKAPAPKGVRLRDGGIEELDEIVRLERSCFPDTPLPTEVLRGRIASGDERVLLAIAGKTVAGFALYERADDGAGYLGVLAVDPHYRSRGIGAALTMRVASTLFAEGAAQLGLKTDDDNAAAIRLYIRLGFRQTQAGRDYSRPADPRVISRQKKLSEGTVIRFGGWR